MTVFGCGRCGEPIRIPDQHVAGFFQPSYNRLVRPAPRALLPGYRFQPDGRIFLDVLAREPEAGQPRLRAIYDRGAYQF